MKLLATCYYPIKSTLLCRGKKSYCLRYTETATPSMLVTVFPSSSANLFLSEQSESSLIWSACLQPVETWKKVFCFFCFVFKHSGFKKVKELPFSNFRRVCLDEAYFIFSLVGASPGHLGGGEGGTTVSTCSHQSPSSS